MGFVAPLAPGLCPPSLYSCYATEQSLPRYLYAVPDLWRWRPQSKFFLEAPRHFFKEEIRGGSPEQAKKYCNSVFCEHPSPGQVIFQGKKLGVVLLDRPKNFVTQSFADTLLLDRS